MEHELTTMYWVRYSEVHAFMVTLGLITYFGYWACSYNYHLLILIDDEVLLKMIWNTCTNNTFFCFLAHQRNRSVWNVNKGTAQCGMLIKEPLSVEC